MNEEVVAMLVRLACGEESEPPLTGLVRIDGVSYRVWKHGVRLRVETDRGELRAIREADRLLTFLEGSEAPIESGPGSLAFDAEDGDVSYSLLSRPRLRDLELDERRVVGTVERGQRFGRATAAVTLEHTYHEDFAVSLTLDAATGMPFTMVEAGRTLLEWLELEVLDVVDASLLRWEGETRSAGWFAYVGSAGGEIDDDADVPDLVREQFRENARRSSELAESFDRTPIVARVPMRPRVESFAPGHVTIDLESDLFVHIRGQETADLEDVAEATEVWTTSDGWTWTLNGSGLEDPELIAAVRDRVVVWRAGLGSVGD